MTSASTSSKTAVPPPQATPPPTGKTNQAELSQLATRQPPPLHEQAYLHGHEPGRDQVRVIVGQAALQQIDAHGRSNLYTELGGALLGKAYQFQDQVYVEIQAALPVISADHGPVHFTFSADTWRQLRQDKEKHYPNLEIVGWFHTHPNLGVFYSSDDVVVHSAAFTLPWHVGLVVDPGRNEACFFGWEEGELKPFPGFYELLDSQKTPYSRWRVVRTSVWKDASEAELARRAPVGPDDTTVYAPRTPKPSFNPGIGLIIGSLGLLLSFFLLVGWVLPLSQQVNRLENVVLMMADEALASSNAAACPDPRLRILAPLLGQRYLAGAQIEVLGTASHPDAARYRVETRPLNAENWLTLRTISRDVTLGTLVRWDTASLAPGVYEMRLTAVDPNNIRLVNTERCEIQIELIP
jgi:proteasome lid subunit RPN8/RPN11